MLDWYKQKDVPSLSKRMMSPLKDIKEKMAVFKAWRKITLMQIWKFHKMFEFIWKQYPDNFALLILDILELFTREIWIFLKNEPNF